MRGLSRTENRSDQPQARGAAPELRPAPRPPRHAFGHGKPSTAPDPRHTARLVKDHSNNNPLRSGRGLGAPSPQRERLTTPALHAQCLLPTSTDWQDRPPPRRRRDRAADHQDAGKPLCGRVQRRGELASSERIVRAATPARAQAPPVGAQRRALALTPERRPAVSCDALQGGSTARRRTGAGRAAPRLGAGRRLPGRQPRAARRAAPRKWQGGATMLTARSGSAWQRTQPYGGGRTRREASMPWLLLSAMRGV